MIFIVLAVLVLVGLFFVLSYNKLVGLRNRCENAWAQVDVQLRRRYDLIPNLVETVKGYAAHEKTVFEEVTAARSGAQAAQGVEQQAAAEAKLSGALGRLLAVAEAYPDLKASQNFTELQGELSDTEQKIAVSRSVYNERVNAYDNARQQIPTNIVAGLFNFEGREYFNLDAGDPAREPVAVKFS